MKKRVRTDRIIFHHSLSDNCDAATIREWHLARKFEDIGYHFVIMPSGLIQSGRDIAMVGAHSFGRNTTSIGCCIVGDFRTHEPTINQVQAVCQLVHTLSHSVAPGWVHPLKFEFHRPHIFNLFEPSEYGRFDACPGRGLDRADLLEAAAKGYL